MTEPIPKFTDEILNDLETDLEREKIAHKKSKGIIKQLRSETYDRSERKVILDHDINDELLKIGKELGFHRPETVAFLVTYYLENEEF